MSNPAKTKIAIFAILAIASISIVSPAFPQGPEIGRARVGVANAPGQGALYGAQTPDDYQIGPGDLIEILVWREPELSRQVRIRPDGKFSYPLVGTITAAGLTIEELQETLRTIFMKYVKYPEITVTVIESTFNSVLVLGEVNYPGIYSYKGTIDALTAIGLAGDFLGTAKRESVIIISDNNTSHPMVRRVNIFRSFRHGSTGDDFLLKHGDVVYVPKTFIADWNKTVADLQPTISLFNSLYGIRGEIRTIYYNKDKPVKKESI